MYINLFSKTNDLISKRLLHVHSYNNLKKNKDCLMAQQMEKKLGKMSELFSSIKKCLAYESHNINHKFAFPSTRTQKVSILMQGRRQRQCQCWCQYFQSTINFTMLQIQKMWQSFGREIVFKHFSSALPLPHLCASFKCQWHIFPLSTSYRRKREKACATVANIV